MKAHPPDYLEGILSRTFTVIPPPFSSPRPVPASPLSTAPAMEQTNEPSQNSESQEYNMDNLDQGLYNVLPQHKLIYFFLFLKTHFK